MPAKVFLIQKEFLQKLPATFQKLGFKQRFENKSTAVKVHMGEYGNLNYVRPPIVGKCVEELLAVGAKPFLFDSLTKYHGNRFTVEDYKETARKNGFTEETIGCPIVISNETVNAEGFMDREVGLCKDVVDADAIFTISHCKGHGFAGFGGAIKNLGFGAVNQETKNVVHGNKRKLLEFIANQCFAVLKQFENGNSIYVNVLNDISKLCDCHGDAGFGIMKGIGIAVSDNIAAIDRASIDLINKEFGQDFFEHLNHIDPRPQYELLEQHGILSDYFLEVI
ncbi:MAG: hypothetical protein CL943_03095 [Candidatus Diapherotrites archaeon]|uniref:DUF362 domain-containing protein n=1 Tax=Candidatus Iainarchaeum sp. TaxID=3101447 RepID=A0A2D6M1G4_9ARCH|nr:hypothetical protein [Candidatus Diapherotrites archaeon]|tara:strand:+ start:909 stop:1748 length:840 start_codon:yes stop_codon:yes gene_type:complete